ncbi:MAG TPA: PqqD family protein [Rhizomicrobium sp.]
MPDRYRRNAKIEESPLQRDLMLYDPEKSQFFVLNATMAYLWKHCDGSKDLAAIIAEMPSDFAAVDPSRAAEEMQAALKELIALGLVESA